ncbi:alpha/beta fold hydrolase [Streptomyces sp. NPDC059209]|uniref:alpha/beta fold hydrolase n=1 Tax=Streptomyces sp. NPDC059209 TaxID=3346769 RepID=UPI0036C3D4DC
MPRARHTTITTADGTRLACTEYGREPSARPAEPAVPVLLLHGLAGHTAEWDVLAGLLGPEYRLVGYDARGHGMSDRLPEDVSRAAHVRDAVAVIDQLALTRPVLIGQSLGGLTALLTAAAHPDLVRALVLVEAGPKGPAPELPGKIGTWLDSWPVPFASADAAVRFFGGGPAGLAWAAGLQVRPDGLYPRIDRDVMVGCVAESAVRSFWEEWDQVRCPTLVVRGEAGAMPASEADEMRVRRPAGTRVEAVAGAGHDVHLDSPAELHALIEEFLHAARAANGL